MGKWITVGHELVWAAGADEDFVAPEGDLRADEENEQWSVVDPAGGRWWPDDEAGEEIAAADDPAAAAVTICRATPMWGTWHT
ncbi:MAG: hypothetical protein Q8Q14_11515 [Gemmatimonadales bacterium]|nr:hypothetical protein [Gemmatimonadales bacterium]